MKLITDGDVSGALLVTDDKYRSRFISWYRWWTRRSLAASALDTFGCRFQGKFLFKSDKDKERAKKMGIKDLEKKI